MEEKLLTSAIRELQRGQIRRRQHLCAELQLKNCCIDTQRASHLSEMGDNPSQFLAEVRVALHDLAATYKLPPMPTAQEKAIREHAKAIIAGVLATAGAPRPH
jgi:hypothetical protein